MVYSKWASNLQHVCNRSQGKNGGGGEDDDLLLSSNVYEESSNRILWGQ